MATGLGKAISVDSPVLTSDGFVPMSQIVVGSRVVGQDGTMHSVRGVYPQGLRDMVEITFNDKTVCQCDWDHLWSVQTKYDKYRSGGFRTLTTRQIYDTLYDKHGYGRWFLPLVQPIEFNSEITAHPYLLGAWLGDGSFRGHWSFTSADQCIVEKVSSLMQQKYGESLKFVGRYDYNVDSNRKWSKFKKAFHELDLNNLYSEEKFIPQQYLLSSVEDRIELLRGLMDTDGCCHKDGHAEYNTSSQQLADNVCWLVRSLGGVTRIRTKPTSFTYLGQKKTGLPCYRITVTLDGINPFTLTKKNERYRLFHNQGQTKSIVGIRPIGPKECQCISVDGGLYVVNDFTVTHNTWTFCDIIREWPYDFGLGSRCLILAENREIVFQNAATAEECCGEPVGIEMADLHAKSNGFLPRIICGTVQTLKSRCRRLALKPETVGLVIIDEAHHSAAPLYHQIVADFPNAKISGWTATADRPDKRPLELFQSKAVDYHILFGIEKGWLVPIRQRIITLEDLYLDRVRTIRGDLDAAQLAEIMEQDRQIHEVVNYLNESVEGRSTLVFTASVKQAHRTAAMLNRAGGPVRAVAVDATTPKSERKKYVADFARGDFQYLVNFGVFLEGWDCYRIGCVAMARPTKARSVYAQAVGRGTRRCPMCNCKNDIKTCTYCGGKTDLLVLDFIGQSRRHKLITAFNLYDGSFDDVVIAMAKKAARPEYPIDVRMALANAAAEVAAQEAARRNQVYTVGVYDDSDSDPFAAPSPYPVRGRNLNEPMTLAQMSFMKARGLFRQGLTKAEASAIIGEFIDRKKTGRWTIKQETLIRKLGYGGPEMTQDEASDWLEKRLHRWR